MDLRKIDVLSMITVIVEIVWRIVMESISAPRWMHHVEWGLIILIFVWIMLHFIFKRKERQNT